MLHEGPRCAAAALQSALIWSSVSRPCAAGRKAGYSPVVALSQATDTATAAADRASRLIATQRKDPEQPKSDTVSMLLYIQPAPSSAQHVLSSCCHMPCLLAARQAAQRQGAVRHLAGMSSAPLSGMLGCNEGAPSKTA
jgi:hypothetical protein